MNVFLHLPSTFCWRKIEKLLGTRDRSLADKWIPAICRNPPRFAETPPSQTEVTLMDSEVKGNPNPNVPLTQVFQSNTADAWWELCSTNRRSGTWRWREMGRKTLRKNSHKRSQEQHNHAVSLSISKFNSVLYIRRVRDPHPLFGSIQCFWTHFRSRWGLSRYISHASLNCGKATMSHKGLLEEGRGWWHRLITVKWKYMTESLNDSQMEDLYRHSEHKAASSEKPVPWAHMLALCAVPLSPRGMCRHDWRSEGQFPHWRSTGTEEHSPFEGLDCYCHCAVNKHCT